jgi:uncharacterized membrane protein YeiB
MNEAIAAAPAAEPRNLAPVDSSERIGVLDALRGFALIGILLMNIEWFGRALSGLGTFDTTLTGLDHAAGWLVRCFIEGKFYKLFALLFGMGFAVMLLRARQTGRPFGAWFTRRMLVLLAIGLLHMVFLWGGDILHDYAFAGLVMLGYVLLLQKPKFQRFDNPRSMLKLGLGWLSVPFVASAFAALVYGVISSNADLKESWLDEQDFIAQVEERLLLPPVAETDDAENPEQPENGSAADETADRESAGDDVALIERSALAERSQEQSSEGPAVADRDMSEESGSGPAVGSEGVQQQDSGDSSSPATNDDELSDEEAREEAISAEVERRRESDDKNARELAVFANGDYWAVTAYRFEDTLERIRFTPFFALTILFPVFLLGYWLIASGAMQRPAEHRWLFKPMAWIGGVFGLFFTVAGLSIIQHPATDSSGLLMGTGQTLFFLGQYVLSAGYLAVIVLWFCTDRGARWLGALAPMGRMALTNYIMQSLILTTLFYGYGAGYFGEVSRSLQILLAIAIIIFQLFASRWWLRNFRFGPLEWLWRSLTYLSLQPLRRTA